MANTIALATKYAKILDEIYDIGAKTAILERSSLVDPTFEGGNAVKVYKLSFDAGLGNYDRTNGYSKGNITGAWETLTLTQDRSKEFSVDTMDDEETLDLTAANLFDQYMKEYITPEVDAYRFAKLASANNITTNNAAINANSVVGLVNTAEATLTDNGVPEEGRIFFMTTTVYNLLRESSTAKNRFVDKENSNGTIDTRFTTFDGMPVVRVPQTRFYDSITVDANNGYSVVVNSANNQVIDSKNLQFLIMDPKAAIAVKKHVKLRVFSPEENQALDAYKIQYRIYHDCFVYDQKAKGIYVQKA